MAVLETIFTLKEHIFFRSCRYAKVLGVIGKHLLCSIGAQIEF